MVIKHVRWIVIALLLLIASINANAAPPTIGIMAYANVDTTTQKWMQDRFKFQVDGDKTSTDGRYWCFYIDQWTLASTTEYKTMKDFAISRGWIYENMLVHAVQNFTSNINPVFSGLDKFDAFENANGVLRTTDNVTFSDLTSTAYAGSMTLQNYVYIGYEEPFDIIKFTISTASVGLTTTVKYWNGSSWVTLTNTDGTSNLTTTGNITFTPPNDWTPKSINGSRTKYFIQLYLSGASTWPITSAIKGDNWLNGAGNLQRGWLQSDGGVVSIGSGTYATYYNPNPPAGALARFPYQARIGSWGANHFGARPDNFQTYNSQSQRTWAQYIATQVLSRASSDGYNCVMFDDALLDPTNVGIAPQNTDYGQVLSQWLIDSAAKYTDTYNAVKAANSSIFVGANSELKTALIGDWNLYENMTYVWGSGRGPISSSGTDYGYDDFLSQHNGHAVTGLLMAIDSTDTANNGGVWERGNRGPIVALSKHYIAQNANTVLVYFSGGGYIYNQIDDVYLKDGTHLHQAKDPTPAASSVKRWSTYFPAMSIDIGVPDTSGWNGGARDLAFVAGGGNDSNTPTWRRDYTNAIVLHRPAYWDTQAIDYATYGNPISLGGTYYPLSADGTISAGVTSIQLRTGEGAILMKSEVVAYGSTTFSGGGTVTLTGSGNTTIH